MKTPGSSLNHRSSRTAFTARAATCQKRFGAERQGRGADQGWLGAPATGDPAPLLTTAMAAPAAPWATWHWPALKAVAMPGRPKARAAPEEARSWAKLLQLQCPDTARAERLLRAVGGYAKRPARCDALAQLVFGLPAARRARRRRHAGRRAGQGPVLATLGRHAHEYTSNLGTEPRARRLLRQARQCQMGGTGRVFSRHSAARHQRPAGAWRAAQAGGRGAQHGV